MLDEEEGEGTDEHETAPGEQQEPVGRQTPGAEGETGPGGKTSEHPSQHIDTAEGVLQEP